MSQAALNTPEHIADWAETRPDSTLPQRIDTPDTPSTRQDKGKSPAYKRATLREEAKIYRLALDGHTQEQIAALMNFSQATVSRTLADWGDTKQAAQDYLASKALDVAARAVEESDALDLLERIDVVKPKGGDKSGSGLQVNIGIALPGLSPQADLSPTTFATKVIANESVSD